MSNQIAAGLSVAQVREIARDAYIYGFPMVDAYRIENAYFVDKTSPQYKVPYNTVASFARVFTPADTVVQTPNSDTPYSFAGLDLRAEPLVITVPPIENGRYFSIQLVDAYTFNFDYIGSRTTGNAGGNYLIAGPGWSGEVPQGVSKVIRSETDLNFAIFRTQLFNANDIENVKAIQAGYQVQPLSAFVGAEAPNASAEIEFLAPLTPDEQRTSVEFFNQVNFVLRFTRVAPEEEAIRAKFASIGIDGNGFLDFSAMPAEMSAAFAGGIADAWDTFNRFS